MNVLQLNVHSLPNKLAEWRRFLQRGTVDVVLLQEWSKHRSADPPDLKPPLRAVGYHWFPDLAGDVGVLVKQSLAAQPYRSVKKAHKSLLAVSLLTANGGPPLVFASYYRNPAGKRTVPVLRTFCAHARREKAGFVVGGV